MSVCVSVSERRRGGGAEVSVGQRNTLAMHHTVVAPPVHTHTTNTPHAYRVSRLHPLCPSLASITHYRVARTSMPPAMLEIALINHIWKSYWCLKSLPVNGVCQR